MKCIKQTEGTPAPRQTVGSATHRQQLAATVLELGREGGREGESKGRDTAHPLNPSNRCLLSFCLWNYYSSLSHLCDFWGDHPDPGDLWSITGHAQPPLHLWRMGSDGGHVIIA